MRLFQNEDANRSRSRTLGFYACGIPYMGGNSPRAPLQPPDVFHLRAAQGWLELGNHLEANAELENIAPELRAHPSILDLRWQIPSGLINVVAIAALESAVFALESDGTVFYVGMHTNGLINDVSNVVAIASNGGGGYLVESDGSVIYTSWTGQQFTNTVVSCLSNIIAISSSWGRTMALQKDGTVVPLDGLSPLSPCLCGAVAVASGQFSQFALRADGSVVQFGPNFALQSAPWIYTRDTLAIPLGGGPPILKSDGTVIYLNGVDLTPYGWSNIVAIAEGYSFELALTTNGTVLAQGYDTDGQCDVPTSLTGVAAIAAGGDHSLALKSDGTVVAWGSNDAGESTVPSGLGPVTAISAGLSDSMALVLPVAPTLYEQLAPEGVVLSWPSVYSGFTVQSSSNLALSDWTDWTNSPANLSGQYWVTNPVSSDSRFFRLRK